MPYFDTRNPGDAQTADWMGAVRSVLARWMVFMDPPEHTRLRRLVNRGFTPKTVQRLAPRVEELVEDLIDDLVADAEPSGNTDFVSTFAFPLPAIVIAELLGVPAADRRLFKTWSDALRPLVFGALDEPGRHDRAARALLELADYFGGLIAEYRRRPADNLLCSLLTQQSDQRLSDEEIVATSVLLLFAGHETTTNLLANGLLALLRHPDELKRLRQDPAMAPRAVEELLRYDGPTKLSVRWVREGFDYAGFPIQSGQRVLLIHASANRDPAVFEHPDGLVLDREHNPHLAFGLAAHYCLGAPLARLEAAIALPRLLRRLPTLRLAGPDPVWQPTILIRGPQSLRISPRVSERQALDVVED